MLINFSTPILNLDGTKAVDMEAGKDGKLEAVTATVGKAAINALMATYKNEENLSGDEKLKRFMLATKIQAADKELEISVEECALLKGLVGKAFTPLIVGRCFEVLDPKSEVGGKKKAK